MKTHPLNFPRTVRSRAILRLRKLLAVQLLCLGSAAANGRLTAFLLDCLTQCLRFTAGCLCRLRPGLALGAALAASGGAQAVTLTARSGAANPFNGIDVGIYSVPALADLDGDGDIDAAVGSQNGTVRYFRNTGTAAAAIFTEQTGAANPFNGFDPGSYVTPAFADVDGDGDRDLIAGSFAGDVRYLKNNGPAAAPVYAEQTGAASPFTGIDIGRDSYPAMADLDGDGDLDLFVGEGYGTVQYYRNTGTVAAPVFTVQTGAANPFNGIDTGFAASPRFADLDKDGDLDAVIGSSSGIIRYYRNTGTATVPVLTGQTGAANPFNGIDVGFDSSVAFADMDGDGDLDVASGESEGTIRYFEDTDSRFAAWQYQNFALPAEAALAAPLADPDGDGLTNLMEYALRKPPKSAAGPGLPAPQMTTDGRMRIVIAVRDDDARLSVAALVQDSPSLTAPLVLSPVITDPAPGDGLRTLTFTMPEGGRQFLRLRFTLSP